MKKISSAFVVFTLIFSNVPAPLQAEEAQAPEMSAMSPTMTLGEIEQLQESEAEQTQRSAGIPGEFDDTLDMSPLSEVSESAALSEETAAAADELSGAPAPAEAVTVVTVNEVPESAAPTEEPLAAVEEETLPVTLKKIDFESFPGDDVVFGELEVSVSETETLDAESEDTETAGEYSYILQGMLSGALIDGNMLLMGDSIFLASDGPVRPKELKAVDIPASVLKDVLDKYKPIADTLKPGEIFALLDLMWKDLFTRELKGKTIRDLLTEHKALVAKLDELEKDMKKNKDEIAKVSKRMNLVASQIMFIGTMLRDLKMDPMKIGSFTELVGQLKDKLEAARKAGNKDDIAKLEKFAAIATANFIAGVIGYSPRSSNPNNLGGSSDGTSTANCELFTLLQNMTFTWMGIPSGFWQGYTKENKTLGHVVSIFKTADGKYWMTDAGSELVELDIATLTDPKKWPKEVNNGNLTLIFDNRMVIEAAGDPVKMLAVLSMYNMIAQAKMYMKNDGPKYDPKEALRLAEAALELAKLIYGAKDGAAIKPGVAGGLTLEEYVESLKKLQSKAEPLKNPLERESEAALVSASAAPAVITLTSAADSLDPQYEYYSTAYAPAPVTVVSLTAPTQFASEGPVRTVSEYNTAVYSGGVYASPAPAQQDSGGVNV